MAQHSESYPTIYETEDFDAADDAKTLRAAMKGFGTDEQAIIDVLCYRTNDERQEIAEYFTETLGRDLIDDLKSELGGKFEDVIVGLMLPTDEYLCKQLHKAMAGIGTDESVLVEILCTKSNDEVQQLVAVYEDMYDRALAEDLCGETGGQLRRLLTMIITGSRDEWDTPVDEDEAREQAEALYDAGEGKLGTDEKVFNRIFAQASFAQLAQVFYEYTQVSGRTIEQAIKSELGGELKVAIMAIVEYVQSPAAYFARRLHAAMAGAGTDDAKLIRIIISRAEIDLGTIKDEYERIYNKTLVSAIKKETSGDYKRALYAIIGEA